MPSETIPVFVNPTAGRGRAGRRLQRILQIFDAAELATNVTVSRAVGDLERQVHEAVNSGARRLVVIGGDGSVHEAVNGMMPSANVAALGVIPSGTGNDFAKASHIPLTWEVAARELAARMAGDDANRRVDVGRMNDRYFANGAGIGFDAKVTRIARSYRWPVGDLVYLFAIFRAMADGLATPDLTIDSDNGRWTGPVTLASISNGAWIGGLFNIAPMAVNDDGRFDLLIAGPVTRRRVTRLLPKLMRGRHMDEPEITHAALRRLSIVAATPVASHLDGEVQPLQTSFDIEVLPSALRLL